MLRSSVFIILILAFESGEAEDLKTLLELGYKNNPEISTSKSSYKAEKSMVAARATPDDPMLGVAQLNRGGETQYMVVSQKIRFPVKYYIQGKAQNSRKKVYRERLTGKKYEVRQKIVSLYYSIYSLQKVIQLSKANMQSVREVARVAERKYAARKASQADSMKAHVELTRLELDLIQLEQQEKALQEYLRAEVNSEIARLEISKLELPTPKYLAAKVPGHRKELLKSLEGTSPKLKSELHKLDESEWKGALAKWEFAPDIQFQYQQRISGNPVDSEIYSVNFTFPLWFWRKASEASAASSARVAQEGRVIHTREKLVSKVKDLSSRVETNLKTLSIYKTSLIPQALGAFNSSRAAYRANKTTFLDLLDSERSLYRVKRGFYGALQQYVENLTQLETELGQQVSNLEI